MPVQDIALSVRFCGVSLSAKTPPPPMRMVVRKGDLQGLFILVLGLAPPTSHSVLRYGRHWHSHCLHIERC
jgi:hypothetical protein